MNPEQVAKVWSGRMTSAHLAMFLLLVVVGVAGRLTSYGFGLWNVTPLAAVGLFAAVHLPGRWAALAPLAVLIVSNVVIGGYGSAWMMVAVYAAALFPLLIGGGLLRKVSGPRVVLASLASSLSFYVATNLAFWLVHRSHTAADLMDCYVDALPFLRLSLWGDLFWSGVLFGGYALATRLRDYPRKLAPVRVKK